MAQTTTDDHDASRIHLPERRIAPEWMRKYTAATARADTIAGVTLAAYMIPASLGDASLAHLPPQSGLYACLCAGLVFWIFCSSRRTAITVTSAISVLLGTSLGSIAGGDPARFVGLAACTALLAAGISLAAWACRAGSLVHFVSETVLLGFKMGVALTLMSTQVPKLVGVSSGHGGFWECVRHAIAHAGEFNVTSAAVGIAALGALVLGRRYFPAFPTPLAVVAAGIVAAKALHLDTRGVSLLGSMPEGLPRIGLPAVGMEDLNELLPLAMACFLLSAVETCAIGKMFGSKHGVRLDANRELLSLGAANLASGMGGGYPVSGGMSQSLVNERAGARTPLSGLVSSLCIAGAIVFLADVLRDLPSPALAAIVLTAVPGLINVGAVRRLWRLDRFQLVIIATALAGVLASGLLRGVMIGAVISMGLVIHRASRPHVARLGRIPGTRKFSDMVRHPDNEPIPGVVIFRPESSLVYFNADHVRDRVRAMIAAEPERPVAVICDCSAMPHVDVAGSEAIRESAAELKAMGIRLVIVEARSQVRDCLRADGLEAIIGRIDRFSTVADAADAARTDS